MEDGDDTVNETAKDEHFQLSQVVYICAAIEILTTLGGSISGVPYIRLIEGAVCQRFYNVETIIAEDLCKGNKVQGDMASLMGVLSSFASLPTLLLTLPYGILAEHIDRRLILLVNFLSSVVSIIYMIVVCYRPETDLRLLWLTGLFDIFGGGSSVSTILVRTMIAEAVPSSALSTLFYRLSGINMIIRLFGTSFGSWLLQNGAASTMLVGTCIWGLTIPLLTFLPRTRPTAPGPNSGSRNSAYTKCEQNDPLELSTKAPGPGDNWIEPPVDSRKTTAMEGLADSLQSFKRLILHSTPFAMCLAIMFINTLALESRALLHPWMSKRYNWDLTSTGYILSVESLLGISILFILQYIDSRSSFSTFDQKRAHELRVAKISMVCGMVGSVFLGLSESRTEFFMSIMVISGSVGFLDAIKAYFTAMLGSEGKDKADIGRLYGAIMMVQYLAMICGGPVWSIIYRWGYGLGGIGLGLPFFGGAALMALTLAIVWKQGR